MTADFVTLRSRSTGKHGVYPARFEAMFEDLERIDSADAPCTDCVVPTVPETVVVTTKDEDKGDDTTTTRKTRIK